MQSREKAMKTALLISMMLLSTTRVLASGEDDPLLGKVMVDQLEWRDADQDDPLAWKIDAWVGKDLRKLWFKTEGAKEFNALHKRNQEFETQLLYSRALTPFWDAQVGWRGDWGPESDRHWLTLGVLGIAPGQIDTSAAFFAGDEGRAALRLEFEYEIVLSQKWRLSPELEVDFHGRNDRHTRTGAGLSTVETSLRLYYFPRKEFAPYVGYHRQWLHGNTADYARLDGKDDEEGEWLIGVRIWF